MSWIKDLIDHYKKENKCLNCGKKIKEKDSEMDQYCRSCGDRRRKVKLSLGENKLKELFG
jgi:Zn finger protein HypA/HybF involved in hydrogenase expression